MKHLLDMLRHNTSVHLSLASLTLSGCNREILEIKHLPLWHRCPCGSVSETLCGCVKTRTCGWCDPGTDCVVLNLSSSFHGNASDYWLPHWHDWNNSKKISTVEMLCPSLLTCDLCLLLIQWESDSRMYSQSFLLWDVKGGGHVDEGGKTVQVVTVGMRKDGVCLNKRGVGGGKEKRSQLTEAR